MRWVDEFETWRGLEFSRRRCCGRRNQSRVVCIQYARITIQAVRNRWQLVAQAVVQGQLGKYLPVIQDEKPVAPFANRALHREDRCGRGLREANYKIRSAVTSAGIT